MPAWSFGGEIRAEIRIWTEIGLARPDEKNQMEIDFEIFSQDASLPELPEISPPRKRHL
jgi:hypothetical protein